MVAYADSSLLLKLYVREPETLAALGAVRAAGHPMIFTALHRLELTGAIRRNVASRNLRPRQAATALRRLRQDLKSGCYVEPAGPWPDVFSRAHRLSRRHSRTLHTRTLYILHVAIALQLGASSSLTFDIRQKLTAQEEGLAVLP
jgi:predicted nucleic acid-binding protein